VRGRGTRVAVHRPRRADERASPSQAGQYLAPLRQVAQRGLPLALQHYAKRPIAIGARILRTEEPHGPLAIPRLEVGKDEVDVAVFDAADHPRTAQRAPG